MTAAHRFTSYVFIGLTVGIVVGVLGVDHAFAQTAGFVPLAKYSGSFLENFYSDTNSLGKLANGLFLMALVFGGIAAVLRFAYAGYLYMGSDMWSSKQHARDILGDTTLGLMLLLAVYLILSQINPQILNLDVLNQLQSSRQQTQDSGGAPANGAFE